MSTREYHLRELNIARSPDDPRHVMPVIGPQHRRILDVGCGAGQTLIASELAAGVQAVGTDLDLEALALGAELTEAIAFVNGPAERLPFADAAFDLAIARVVLPWTNLPAAIAELGRVLRSGGEVWMSLHSLSHTLDNVAGQLRRGQPKHALYTAYVLANGLLFAATGRLVRFPSSGRIESFQTDGSIGRELSRAGFTNFIVQHGRHYVVSATKR